ncbi:somatostatin receptor type 5-like [Kryptolebias marmoratus]|uniref:Somatostatin receptor 5 n=1 Tax=Kryptolebias marmoratus TaxID=37003 RepID=A0A3Q3EDU8_KRYMA|nr:somatostatin receptor type 5-like [Kryptolebias marmoratus]XP_017277236.1 somatostatin receptor type 5-like [Kryptolebias marmoratus]
MDPSILSFYMDNRTLGNENNSTFIPLHNTNNSGHDPDLMPLSRATAVIYAIVFIVGFLGNTLAIYIVARYSKMKTVTNMYILNLAVADELYILGIPFIGTNTVFSYWPYGEFLCKVCMTVDSMSQFASTFCLTLMSIDRFLAVVYPIRSSKWRKPRVAKIFSSLVWVVAFLMVLPITIFSHVQKEFNTCNISWPDPINTWSTVFILYTSILGFFGPLVVICLCYLIIVIKVKSAGVRAGLTRPRRSERKVTRMVVIIVLVFILCWLPFFTVNIANVISTIPETESTVIIYSSLVILTYINSCANPVLYAFLSDNFHQSMKKVLCFKQKNTATATSPKVERHNVAKSVQMGVNKYLDSEPFIPNPVINSH